MFNEEHDVPVTFKTDFHAGSVGETLKMLSDDNLTGLTVQAVVISPNNLRYIVPAVASSDGTYAYITTTSSTFPYPGVYNIQLEIVNAGSPPTFTVATTIQITVLPVE